MEQIKKIERELEKWLPGFNMSGQASVEATAAGSLWTEMHFPKIAKNLDDESMRALLTPAKDILSRGGKRWRPLLMTLICQILGGGDAALPLVPLIEFSHNASLIHDDIEDDSNERRGKPAIHKIYNVDAAINSGSFLYFLAMSCVEFYNGNNKELIYKLYGKYLRGLHLGQAIDISWHRKVSFIPTTDDYLAMCCLKTGGLARLAAELGVYAAGGSMETAEKLGEAADNLGVGFQILDDVKNLTTGIEGKIHGDDIVEGKKSLPIILYLTRYPDKREFVYFCFHTAKTNGPTVPEVKELMQCLAQTGILEEAEKKGHDLINAARNVFSAPEFTGNSSEKSRTLMEGFINLIS